MNFRALLHRLPPALSREDVFCRLIGAWLGASFLLLLQDGGSYAALAYSAAVSPLAVLGIASLVFLALTAVRAALPSLQTDSWFLLAVSTAAAYYWLVKGGQLLLALAVFVAYLIVLLYFARKNAGLLLRIPISRRTLIICAAALGVLSCAVISVIGCLRYLTFHAPNFDFGLFCNMFYNMQETGLPLSTSERDALLSHFAVHVSPIYYLILPFFCIFPSPLTLQIAQAVVLTAGVIPLLLLARHYKLSGRVCTVLAALYLFYPALTRGCFYDLHENCFLPILLLFTFYFYEKKLYIPMYISAVLVLCVKEDAAVYLLLFAVYLLISRRAYLHGSVTAVLSVAYFCLAGFLLTRYGEGMMVNRFNNLIYDKADGLLGAIKTAIVNPGFLLTQLFSTQAGTWDKIAYALQMLLPLGLIPFFTKRVSRLLLVAPILINLLTMYTYQYDIGFQYHFGILAFLFYATVQALPELLPSARVRWLSVGLSACLCFYAISVPSTLVYYKDVYKANRDDYKTMQSILDLIPEDASVSASTFLLPHVADCKTVYETYYHGKKTDVDYVALDLRYGEDNESLIRYYVNRGYRVFAEAEGLLVIYASSNVPES